jgi:hypothetical protein
MEIDILKRASSHFARDVLPDPESSSCWSVTLPPRGLTPSRSR